MGIAVYAIAAVLGAGFAVGFARGVMRRRDIERRQAERMVYDDRQNAAERKKRETAFARTAERFFPYFVEAARARIKAGVEPRQALREALVSVPGVDLGIAEPDLRVVAAEDSRTRHILIWGMSGRGKSVCMTHLIRDDIAKGRAIIVVCPEREMFPPLLAMASDRAADVLYYAPGDPRCSISYNGMALDAGDEKDRHADEVSSTLKRCFGEQTIGTRSDPLLANAIALVIGTSDATFATLRRALVDSDFREKLLAATDSEYVKQYFRDVYSKYADNVSLPLLARLDAFLRTGACRRALCHPTGSFTIRQILEERKILLVDLSGLPPDSMQLIGGLLTCKLLLEILRRETSLAPEKRAVRIYIDEFPAVCGFSEAAWEGLLSRGRKYHASLCLAGQFPSAVPLGIRQQLAGNVSTLISFALSSRDASAVRRELLVPGADNSLNPIPAESLVSLPVGHGYVRLGAGACALKVRFNPPIEAQSNEIAERVRELSWVKYGVAAPEPETVLAAGSGDSADGCREAVTAVYASEPGRGGAKHKLIQRLAREWGEARGFRSTVEEEILGGAGRVDVALVRDDVRIAVEVAVTSTPDQIAASVTKAFAAGFTTVVVLSPGSTSLKDAGLAVAEKLDARDRARVLFLDPERLRSFLDELPKPAVAADSMAGYVLNVETEPVPRASFDSRRRTLARLVGAALLRQRPPS